MKRVQMLLSESTLSKLDRIAEYYGFESRTAAMNIAVTNAHQKLFPEYVESAKKRADMTPQLQAEITVAKEEAKAKVRSDEERKKLLEIASRIDESEIITTDGKEYVRYPLFNMPGPRSVDKTIDTIPLVLITEDNVVGQYHDILGNSGEQAKKMVKKYL